MQSAVDRLTARSERYAKSDGQGPFCTSAFAHWGLFAAGKMAKSKSPVETERIRALTDPQVAANWVMRICMENNCAVIRMLHKDDVADAPPAPPTALG